MKKLILSLIIMMSALITAISGETHSTVSAQVTSTCGVQNGKYVRYTIVTDGHGNRMINREYISEAEYIRFWDMQFESLPGVQALRQKLAGYLASQRAAKSMADKNNALWADAYKKGTPINIGFQPMDLKNMIKADYYAVLAALARKDIQAAKEKAISMKKNIDLSINKYHHSERVKAYLQGLSTKVDNYIASCSSM